MCVCVCACVCVFIKLMTKMKKRIDKPQNTNLTFQEIYSNCLAVHFSVYTVG